MSASEPSSIRNVEKREGPSRRIAIAILLPVLALVAYLAVWAYQVGEWTWFTLMVVAAIGLVAFAVAPDMFSIRERDALILTMPRPQDSPAKAVGHAASADTSAPIAPESAKKEEAPDRTA